MTTDEIREYIAKAKMETAVKAVLDLTANTDLEDLGIEISQSYRRLKRNVISGILSVSEERQENALITNRVLSLLNEYEIQQIKDFKNTFEQLKKELESQPDMPGTKDTIEEINAISKEMQDIDSIESKEEVKPGAIDRIGKFLTRLKDPDSKEGKVIQIIKNGVQISQTLAGKYNSIAQWFGLPQVPRLFLGDN